MSFLRKYHTNKSWDQTPWQLMTCQSGQWKGQPYIVDGRKPLRDALYIPALVAIRCNPDQKEK
jgi:hypothetical protein